MGFVFLLFQSHPVAAQVAKLSPLLPVRSDRERQKYYPEAPARAAGGRHQAAVPAERAGHFRGGDAARAGRGVHAARAQLQDAEGPVQLEQLAQLPGQHQATDGVRERAGRPAGAGHAA